MHVRKYLAMKILASNLIYFLAHPGSLSKYGMFWLGSLVANHVPTDCEIPFMNFSAIRWLESYLRSNMAVFEWGSGGSTLFLVQRVNELVSVEHDDKWHRKVSRSLSAKGVTNCKYLACEPEDRPAEPVIAYSP